MWFFSPYRPDIQQGNFVSEEMLAQLKVGMTRDQVRFVLGTSLLTDIFHADRWDYPFRLARGSGETTSSRVVVFFDKEGKVARFEGGNLPTEKEYIDRIAGPSPFAKVAKADVSIMGSGGTEFDSDGEVTANIMGSGNVTVNGRATCTLNSLGSGKLTCNSVQQADK